MKSFSIRLFSNGALFTPVKLFIRSILILLLLFAVARVLFLFQHAAALSSISRSEYITCFTRAIPLDLSAAALCILIPWTILLLGFIYPHRIFFKLFHIALTVLAFGIIAIQSIDILLYFEWQCKLNYKAFTYVQHPDEIIQTVSNAQWFSFLALCLVQIAFYIFIRNLLLHPSTLVRYKSKLYRIVVALLSIGVLLLMYRGGFKTIPINTSDTYFSKNQTLNDACTNTIWYTLQSIYENSSIIKQKPFTYFTEYEAKQRVDAMYTYTKATTPQVIKTTTPNMVIIVLESFCADVSRSLQGSQNCTPFLDSLVRSGISFTQCYAPGWRSDMGMASILSALPCEPYRAITPQVSKYKGLPSFTKAIKQKKYKTQFLYGGQLRYANLKSYIFWNDFDKIKEEAQMNLRQPSGKLGIHDEALFKEAIQDLQQVQQPFCSFIYTMSSHPPYDMPMKPVFTNGGNENQYINSVFYTDQCLQQFFSSCQKQAWYNNTLFVLIADHGHATPSCKQWEATSHRIPFILCGPALVDSFQGKQFHNVISQTDMCATLLQQLQLPYNHFIFSKDALNPNCPQFAPYVKHMGYGMISNTSHYCYGIDTKRIDVNHTSDSLHHNEFIQNTKAYIQRTFNFIDAL